MVIYLNLLLGFHLLLPLNFIVQEMQTWRQPPREWEITVPGEMGFGQDLRNSHEGLIKLQDWELKLLETVKRFMTLRVKSDKEYAALLLNISQQVDKQDNSTQIQYISTVSKVNSAA